MTVAFFLVSSLVSVLLAVFLYRFIERQLAAEVRVQLGDMATIGAAEVEAPGYYRLLNRMGSVGKLPAPLRQLATLGVEHGDDFKEIDAHLQMMRRAEPTLLHYAYILAPTDDPDNPRFVVDADVRRFEALIAEGKPLPPNESISHFAQTYDVSDIPLLKEALKSCTKQ